LERRVLKVDKRGKNIVIVVTLDTKGEEALYLKELIKRRGHNPLVMDVGTGGEVPFQADFTREELALATGRSLEEIRAGTDRYSDVLAAVAMGGKSIIQNLVAKGKIDGLLSIGGSLGTTQALTIMRERSRGEAPGGHQRPGGARLCRPV